MPDIPEDIRHLQGQILNARHAFRARARQVLFKAYEDAETISSAIGTISVDEAWDAWARQVVEKLAQS
jgi:hypothetical protein